MRGLKALVIVVATVLTLALFRLYVLSDGRKSFEGSVYLLGAAAVVTGAAWFVRQNWDEDHSDDSFTPC